MVNEKSTPTPKSWPLGVLLTAVDGKVMCDWGEFKEFSEWLLERPIWTHHYPALADKIAAAVKEQLPQIADWDGAHITPENVFDELERQGALRGEYLTLEPRPFQGEWTVEDGLAPGAKVIKVMLS